MRSYAILDTLGARSMHNGLKITATEMKLSPRWVDASAVQSSACGSLEMYCTVSSTFVVWFAEDAWLKSFVCH